MNRLLLFLVIATTTITPNLMGENPTVSIWRGILEVEGQQIRLEVVVDTSHGQPTGVFRIKDRGSTALTEVQLTEEVFSFSISKIRVSFSGKLSEQHTVAKGVFSQGGKSRPLTLKKAPSETGEADQIWQGVLTVNQMELAMQLRLIGEPVAGTAYFDSLDEKQSYRATWSIQGDVLTFDVPFIQLQFEGVIETVGNSAKGTWRQPDREIPFSLKKLAGVNKKMALDRLRGEGTSSPANSPSAADSSKEKALVKGESIPAKALARLAAEIQIMVDNEEMVGGELLVIKDRRPVLRQAFGWKDREKSQPMQVDAVYCVRSMTKPLVGTAIQMLMDANQVKPATLVSEILPIFSGPETRKITLQHLLEHTSGLPFITTGKPLADYANIAEVVAEIAASELDFEPGRRFQYSDAGSITLGAVVAEVTGMPVAQFIQERILEPLQMQNTFPLIGNDKQVLARIPSAYSGGTGSWSKHWEPSDPPIFPIFLTSASLFSTTTDYARFLELWLDGGQVGRTRLLSADAVKRGLAPRNHMSDYPANFSGLETHYGQQWIVYVKAGQGESPRTVLFGHDGSDGTHSWVWPEYDLMVLFFTQSRGTLAGMALQSRIEALLINQDLDEPQPRMSQSVQGANKDVAGLYWDETARNAYYVITPKGNRLEVERPGKMLQTFKPGEITGRYYHEASSKVWFEFLRAKDGTVTGMRTSFGGRIEHNPKHKPVDGLPSLENITAAVTRAHRVDRLTELGAVRMTGSINFETRGMVGKYKTLFDSERERTEIQFGRAKEIFLKKQERVWAHGSPNGTEELKGARREQALLDQVPVRFGDWTQHFHHVEVLKQIQVGDYSLILVRVEPLEGPGATMFVDEQRGLLMAMDSLVHVPGMGIVGVHTRFQDYRNIDGMQLPFRSVATFTNKLLGTVVTTVNKVKTGVKVRKNAFSLPRFSQK